MKKNYAKVAIVVLMILVSFEIAHASFFAYGDLFAGKISATKATEIEDKENEGFTCNVDGTTITIDRPIRGPETYIIPFGTRSKTSRSVDIGSWIMGRYEAGSTSVSCEKVEGDTVIIEDVSLNTITLFGNS